MPFLKYAAEITKLEHSGYTFMSYLLSCHSTLLHYGCTFLLFKHIPMHLSTYLKMQL